MDKTFTQAFSNTCKLALIWLISGFLGMSATAGTTAATNHNEVFKTHLAVDQTITFPNIPTKTYADADFDPGATASSGLPVNYISSNTTVATIVNGKVRIIGLGTSVITAAQPGNADYNVAIRVSRTITVTKATVTVTAVSQTRVYGNNNANLSVTYTGLKAGETFRGITASTTANLNSSVGVYDIDLSTATSPKYDFVYVKGSITVTKAPLIITAASKTKLYGAANPALSVVYSGFKLRQTNAVLLTQPELSTSVTAGTLPGTYSILVSKATASNYDITFVNGTFTVQKGNLRVTAVNKVKAYGAEVPALTYSITGFAAGETPAVLTSPVIISTTATPASVVASYPITVSGATAVNYNITFIQGTLTVNRATLRVIADSKSKAYGQENPALTISYAGFVLGETPAILTTLPTASTTAQTTSPIGNYNITVSGATAANYNISYVTGRLTIAKATLRIIADNKSRFYGDPNPPLTITYSGFIAGESQANLTTQPSITTTATTASRVGNYSITVKGALAANYAIVYTNGTLTVTKADLAITANNVTRIYGATTPAYTASYTGFKNGETAASIGLRLVFTSPYTINSPVGTYPLNINNLATANYNVIINPGTVTVVKRTLFATAVNKNKPYGAAVPALTVAYTGFVNRETAASVLTGQPVLSTTATAASERGTYPITITGNLAANNYDITYVNGILTIGKATLRVIVTNKTKIYGQPNPALTYTYSGFVNGDNATALTATPADPVTTATAGSPAGTYAITTAGGAAADDYDIVYVAGRLTVAKATLNVTLDYKYKVYGDPNPPLTYTITGFVNGDTQESAISALPVATTVDPGFPVGSFSIKASGGVSANYAFRFNVAYLVISKANLLITPNNTSRGYGSPNPVFTASYTGLKNGDTEASLATPPVFTTTANITSEQGTYPITASAATSPNYNITYAPGTLTVTKAPLIVKANDAVRAYGLANPAFTVSYTGFVAGDTEASLNGTVTASSAATVASNAGTYAIVLAQTIISDRYQPIYQNGVLTVNKVALTVTGQNAEKVYGAANPAFTAQYTGFVNGQDQSALTTLATGTTAATASSGVGVYDVDFAGATATNYSFNYVSGKLNVTPAALNIRANNASRTYGAANPAFTATYTGFVGTDNPAGLTTLPVLTTTANASTGVGNYTITAGGAVSNNYTITYALGNLNITKALLNITADDKTRVYGAANPALTVSYNGFVNGETEAVLSGTATASISTAITASTNAGVYDIAVAGATSNNYDLVYRSGKLTITKAPLTIRANNESRLFGTANPAFSATFTGFVGTDTRTSLTAQPVITTAATSASAVGNYAIIPSGAASLNYNISYVNGQLTITSNTANITFVLPSPKIYGDADFDAGATNSAGEPMVYTSSNTAVATVVNGRIHIVSAGTSVIAAAFAPSSNYSSTPPVTQVLVVNKANQSITFNSIPAITRGATYTIISPTATSGLPVQLSVGESSIASLNGLTLTAQQIGNTSVTATQDGNQNYNPAVAVVQQVVVNNVEGRVEIQVHQAVSPDGDGVNDIFFIEGIRDHPDNKVTIVNRNGVKIFEVNGYDNASRSFNGRSNITGAMQQQGTYFYLIEYITNGQGRHLTGYFVLKY